MEGRRERRWVEGRRERRWVEGRRSRRSGPQVFGVGPDDLAHKPVTNYVYIRVVVETDPVNVREIIRAYAEDLGA